MRLYSLEQVPALSVETVGRKAKNLAAARAQGYRVCDGVVLGTEVFQRFCDIHGISPRQATAESIRSATMTEELRTPLFEAYTRLRRNGRQLIVRSSAVEEDGDSRTFAGLFESVAHIDQWHSFIEAIKTVWASAYSPAAIAYRGEGTDTIAMAVLIQSMCVCDLSGVLFTRDPLTAQDHIVVECACWSNEGITSGNGDFTRYRLDKRSGHRLEAHSNGRALLSAAQRRCLCRAGRDLEAAFGYPCDIEWGLRQGQLWLFQVRPMSIQSRPHLYRETGRDDIDAVLLDRYALPASVCYLSLLDAWQNQVYLRLFRNTPGSRCDEQPLVFLHNRVYWNTRYQRDYFEEPADTYGKRLRLRWLMYRGYRSWYRRLPAYERSVAQGEAAAERIEDMTAAVALLDRTITVFCRFLGRDHFRFLGYAQRLYAQLRNLCVGDTQALRIAETLVGRYSLNNRTVQANTALQQLALRIRRDASLRTRWEQSSPADLRNLLETDGLPADLCRAFREFLQMHGHRGVACDDLLYPHWREQPEPVIELLQQFVAQGLMPDSDDKETARLEKALCQRLGKRARAVLGQVRLTGEYMRLRENQRYYFDKSWVLLRRLLRFLGRELAALGHLDDADDIFHLSIDEVRLAALYPRRMIDRQMLAGRKQALEQETLLTPPYMLKAAQAVAVQKGAGFASYKGMGISAGVATGPVQTIHGLEDLSQVRRGSIGVVDTFHPSWTPLLELVSGLIMSYGNLLSHGAVVAREYGIPVVVFNARAAAVFQTGDIVQIQGDTGRIRVIERATHHEKETEGVMS